MKLRTLAAPVMLALFVLISPAWAQNSATNKGKDITSLDLGSLQQLAEVGDVSAQMEMAARYFEGKGGVVKDRVQALVWWHKAADRGEAKAKFFIGMMYELGSGVPKDDAQAFAWYLKAAQQGYAMGERQKTGYGYLHGLGVERDYTQALSWYQKAVVHGFAAAEYYLGYMYSIPTGWAFQRTMDKPFPGIKRQPLKDSPVQRTRSVSCISASGGDKFVQDLNAEHPSRCQDFFRLLAASRRSARRGPRRRDQRLVCRCPPFCFGVLLAAPATRKPPSCRV